jgi:hypothetical protein
MKMNLESTTSRRPHLVSSKYKYHLNRLQNRFENSRSPCGHSYCSRARRPLRRYRSVCSASFHCSVPSINSAFNLYVSSVVIHRSLPPLHNPEEIKMIRSTWSHYFEITCPGPLFRQYHECVLQYRGGFLSSYLRTSNQNF